MKKVFQKFLKSLESLSEVLKVSKGLAKVSRIKSLSKVSSLLFRLSPFDFLLNGLENLDKHLDDEDVDEMVEAFELPPLEQASI